MSDSQLPTHAMSTCNRAKPLTLPLGPLPVGCSSLRPKTFPDSRMSTTGGEHQDSTPCPLVGVDSPSGKGDLQRHLQLVLPDASRSLRGTVPISRQARSRLPRAE